jgi:hypothetical protein
MAQTRSSWGNLSNHPLVVLILVLAALVAIIAFVTGKPSLPAILSGNTPTPSLETPTPQVGFPTSTPLPQFSPATLSPMGSPGPSAFASPTIAGPRFGPLIFCTEQELDEKKRSCTVSRQVFTSPIFKIIVSWTYQGVYKGMKFSRKWYRDGAPYLTKDSVWDGVTWKLDGDSEYTWIEEAHGLQPGLYNVDFYIGDNPEPVQQGSFVIR